MDKKSVLERIKDWANSQDEIRAIILTSSQTNPEAPRDPLSDFDIVLYTRKVDRFSSDDSWLSFIGEILIKFNDQWEEDGDINYTRLVIYKDGTKIDFSLTNITTLEKIVKKQTLPDSLEVGYEVLIDKDNLTTGLKKPTYKAHIPKVPTEKEYLDLVNEFFWETTYVAKNLYRNELFPMKYSFDYVIKLEILRKLLEWYIEIEHNWDLKPGDNGRHLKKYLPEGLWTETESTFAGTSVDANWSALFKAIHLFRGIAQKVANNLGYSYPTELDSNVSEYLNGIKNLKQ